MKVKSLLAKAKKELTNDREIEAVRKIKAAIKNVEYAKKTVSAAEKHLNKLLETDLEDIEEDDFEY